MFRAFPILFLAMTLAAPRLHAVEMNGTFDTTAPTSADIANWDTGWGASGITGWDYVGSVGGVDGASGVYLGNGWVLTAAHVGPGTFVLTNGPAAGVYTYSGVSEHVTAPGQNPDLTLFKLNSTPSLPALSLATGDPSQFLYTSVGDKTAMIGYGGSPTSPITGLHLETWGYDTVALANVGLSVTSGATFVSNDFITSDAGLSNGSASITDNSQLVGGDSGGGDFIYNSSLGEWQLAGINEAIGSAFVEKLPGGQWVLSGSATPGATNVQNIDLSAMVQIDGYRSTIMTIDGVPEPPAWSLLLLALGGWVLGRRIVAPRWQDSRAS